MSKIVIIFYKNGEHERLDETVGTSFPVNALVENEVDMIYAAVNETDAKNMIDLQVEKYQASKKTKDATIQRLADRLIETLDDSIPAEQADGIVASVAKELYNDVLGIAGNIVIDKDHPVARVHGGFGKNGKRAAAIIAKYKFEETSDDNRPNRTTDISS